VVVAKACSIEFRVGDLLRLRQVPQSRDYRVRDYWLNDECVNLFSGLVQKRERSRKKPYFYCNSYFFSKLYFEEEGYCYENVARWTKRVNPFEMEKIFIPVNEGQAHWTLLVMFPQKERIEYYDSLHGDGTSYMQALIRFFGDEWKARLDDDDSVFTNEGWVMINANPPRQTNGVDCGVCVCINTYFA
jgi:sentrin-specific protease 1